MGCSKANLDRLKDSLGKLLSLLSFSYSSQRVVLAGDVESEGVGVSRSKDGGLEGGDVVSREGDVDCGETEGLLHSRS